MQSKGVSVSQLESEWLGLVANYGSPIDGDTEVTVHHCIGASKRAGGMNIGKKFVLGLTPMQHTKMGNDTGRKDLSLQKYGFLPRSRWELEKLLFCEVYEAMGHKMYLGKQPFVTPEEFEQIQFWTY